MNTVKTILEKKGKQHFSVKPTDTVKDALNEMASKDVGALMVIENGKLVGMFSERDYVRKILTEGCEPSSKVSNYMTKSLYVVNLQTTLSECMALMTKKRIRHLPVVENNSIEGLISIGDVVNSVIQEQEFTIKDMEKYISGAYGS